MANDIDTYATIVGPEEDIARMRAACFVLPDEYDRLPPWMQDHFGKPLVGNPVKGPWADKDTKDWTEQDRADCLQYHAEVEKDKCNPALWYNGIDFERVLPTPDDKTLEEMVKWLDSLEARDDLTEVSIAYHKKYLEMFGPTYTWRSNNWGCGRPPIETTYDPDTRRIYICQPRRRHEVSDHNGGRRDDPPSDHHRHDNSRLVPLDIEPGQLPDAELVPIREKLGEPVLDV